MILTKYQYYTDEERTAIFNEHTDLHLVEEQNITEGNFLIFSSIVPVYENIKIVWANNEMTYNELLYFKTNYFVTEDQYNEIYNLNPHQ